MGFDSAFKGLKGELRVTVFGRGVLREIFGPGRKKVTG
jgi:hypothetical protein